MTLHLLDSLTTTDGRTGPLRPEVPGQRPVPHLRTSRYCRTIPDRPTRRTRDISGLYPVLRHTGPWSDGG